MATDAGSDPMSSTPQGHPGGPGGIEDPTGVATRNLFEGEGGWTGFFELHPDVVLFCRDAAGHPIGYPMRVASVSNGRVHFSTYRKSAKIRHLTRDPRACVLGFVVTGEEVVWLSVSGGVTVWSPSAVELDQVFSGGDALKRSVSARRTETRTPGSVAELARRRMLDGKRVVVSIASDDVRIGRGSLPVGRMS